MKKGDTRNQWRISKIKLGGGGGHKFFEGGQCSSSTIVRQLEFRLGIWSSTPIPCNFFFPLGL